MMHVLKRAWADVFQPLWAPARRAQVAALCMREDKGCKQVLLITSRDTGRWIVPKGWPIEGLDGPGSALQEAWEEAGVKEADVSSDPVGYFSYMKGLDNGEDVPVWTSVYLTRVTAMSDTYPEDHQRTRKWCAPEEAAALVDEPELQDILRAL